MKHLLQRLAALVLLVAPALAVAPTQPTLPAAPAPVVVQDLSSSEQAQIDALAAAKKTKKEAEAAALADGGNADLKTAAEEAKAAYEALLEEARATRDASGGKEAAFGTALYEVSADAKNDGSVKGSLGLVAKWTQQGKDWLVNEGPGMAVNLVIFLVILLVFKVLAGIAGSIVRKALSSNRVKATDLLKRFLVGVVQKIVFFTGLVIALEQVGVPVAPLLAGVGVVGFVIGFALQDTLSNFASGVMILLYRPFDVGDFINAAGEAGSVSAMSLVSTTITTPDNQLLILPNSSIWGGVIRNVTAQDTRRVDMTVGVSYDADLDQTGDVLMEVVTAHEKVMKDPAPVIKVVNLGDNSVDFVVRPWCKTSDYWDVFFDLNKQIKQRLDKEGIGIPYPQRDLHLVSVGEGVKLGS